MKKLSIIGVLVAASLGSPAAALAAPGGPGGFGNAQDTINALQAQGFNVQLNGASESIEASVKSRHVIGRPAGECPSRCMSPTGQSHPQTTRQHSQH